MFFTSYIFFGRFVLFTLPALALTPQSHTHTHTDTDHTTHTMSLCFVSFVLVTMRMVWVGEGRLPTTPFVHLQLPNGHTQLLTNPEEHINSWCAFSNPAITNTSMMRTRAHKDQMIKMLRFQETIHTKCDWVFYKGCQKILTKTPKTIYLDTKNNEPFLDFYKKYYPTIPKDNQFAIITGGSDRTFPRQVDLNSIPWTERNISGIIHVLLSDPRLVVWFTENMDQIHSKIRPIPLGVVHEIDAMLYQDKLIRGEKKRPIKLRKEVGKDSVLCIANLHRSTTDRFVLRRIVAYYCHGVWANFSLFYERVNVTEFNDLLTVTPFTLCVHGGGLDPNPKVFTAILIGSIPIVQRNPMTSVFDGLPVVVIDDWTPEAITMEKMKVWLEEYRPYFEDPEKRKEVLRKMGLMYWWGVIMDEFERMRTM